MGNLSFQSLSAGELVSTPVEVQLDFEIPVETTEGFVNIPIAVLKSVFIQGLDQRVTELEQGSLSGGTWNTARTLTLTGAVTGSVSMDGSQNVSMTTSIPAGSLPMTAVSNLTPTLAALANDVDDLQLQYREVTANSTLTMGDILTAASSSGAIALQLPEIDLTDTRPITVYRHGANPVTILLGVGQTLEQGPDNLLMDQDNSMAVLAPNSATNWRLCNRTI